MRVHIRGKTWTLVEVTFRSNTYGECDSPTKSGKQIRIKKGLKDHALLDTTIHEVTHAALWDLGEGPVDSLAGIIALTLWENGLRQELDRRPNMPKLEHDIVGVMWTRGEVAVLDEEVRRATANAISRVLTRLGWAYP